MKKYSDEPFVIRHADFTVTKLIDENNKYHEKVGIGEAKKTAQMANLDLVCFNRPNGSTLAFCKIIDFGKWRYTEGKKKKKNKGAKKETKEMRFSPVISDHDIEHKIKQVIEFLDENDDVVLSMRLKGRQRAHYSDAEKRMDEIVALCDGHGSVISTKKSSSLISIRVGRKKEEK